MALSDGSALPRVLWDTGADPGALRAAAVAWRTVGGVATDTGTAVDAAGRALLAGWLGPSADAYAGHRPLVVRGYATATAVAGRIADTLDAAADVLATAQAHLDDAWLRLGRTVPGGTHGAWVRYDPTDPRHVAAVTRAVREATAIRTDADHRLADLSTAVNQARADLGLAAEQARAAGRPGAWPAAPEPGSAGLVMLAGDRVIVNGTGDADTIAIRTDAATGEPIIRVAGQDHRLPPGLAVLVRAGGGNDTITVEPGTRVRVTLLGGEGEDRLVGADGDEVLLGGWGHDTVQGGAGSDRLLGGEGDDYLDGQAGDDRLYGGDGDDTLYGLDGADHGWGERGRDVIDGGAGTDALAGGDDADVLVGGRDADLLYGGSGADTLYGGAGADRLHGGGPAGLPGVDRAFVQPDDAVAGVGRAVTVELTDVGGFIRVEGSPEFVARVESDLDALRSSPRGTQMLAALQASHEQSGSDLPLIGALLDDRNTLVIRETAMANGLANRSDLPVGPVAGVIGYNPTWDDLPRDQPVPPVVVLFHELAHVYDHFHGTMAVGTYDGADNQGVPNRERVAVGLPIDDDGDPATANQLVADHPYALTENGLRDEFGLHRRTTY